MAEGETCMNDGADTAYSTLVLNDRYVPGALVLAAQLRKFDPGRPLVCLIANTSHQTSISKSSIHKLELLFDKLVNVDTIDAGVSPELELLARPELRLATTKLHLWKLPYRKVVYLDADTLPVQSIQCLFDVLLPSPNHIAASPDCGWPDLFNSGVFVFQPNKEIAEYLIGKVPHFSWIDGSDQGLLNQEFEWVRIPFLYNVTVNATYEYLPAYQRFQNDIKILHFIGSVKPWERSSSFAPAAELQKWHSAYSSLPDAILQLNSQEEPTSEPASHTEMPWLDEVPVVKLDKIISAPPDYWDPSTHAPLKNTRPEGEALAAKLDGLSIEKSIVSTDLNTGYKTSSSITNSSITDSNSTNSSSTDSSNTNTSSTSINTIPRTSRNNNNTDIEDNDVSSRTRTGTHPIHASSPRFLQYNHIFPAYGPTTTTLPFETNQRKPERFF